MASVVWCNKCKTAVWAYDHLKGCEDPRGLMNLMGMPCPKCGEVANLDGWNSRAMTLEEIPLGRNFPDWWSTLRAIFYMNVKDGKWEISPDCYWFRRPEMPDQRFSILMNRIQEDILREGGAE